VVDRQLEHCGLKLNRHCERGEAIQSFPLDCFVAALLAMMNLFKSITLWVGVVVGRGNGRYGAIQLDK
jgi:hypothetical protein